MGIEELYFQYSQYSLEVRENYILVSFFLRVVLHMYFKVLYRLIKSKRISNFHLKIEQTTTLNEVLEKKNMTSN